jgi:predicted phage baseplate assembly protein
MTGKSTEIVLEKPSWADENPGWLDPATAPFAVIRGTTVFAESERLELAEEPIPDDVYGDEIELAELYGGLEPGRWLIIAGERTDVEGTSGVPAAELAMLASIEHGVRAEVSPVAGDKVHSFLTLSDKLAYRYKRDTVLIYGNVVPTTHGERRLEVVANADASQPFQTVMLRQYPLTYVPAANASGTASTLEMRVNEVRWHQTDMLAGLGPTDRRFLVRLDDEGRASVTFGNGREGARPPTGAENIRASYRIGIGVAGNVKAGQITLLATRPLGVKEVVNPLPATGGADRESRDEARRNVPLALLALDRLVSAQDYADFARTFAGIGKAVSARLWDGDHNLVHLTVAGGQDAPIATSSDLYRNLQLALSRLGDPSVPVQIDVRTMKLLFVRAGIRALPDYQWEAVEARVREVLLEAFSFDRRELGQDVVASEVISIIQAVPGVAYVDLDKLDGLHETITEDDLQRLTGTRDTLVDRVVADLARRNQGVIAPAELIVLSPHVPEMLLLSEIVG